MARIFIFIGLFFWFLFSTCTPKSEDETQKNKVTDGPHEKKTIRWLAQWYGEGKKETLVREIARDFSFTHQDYEVQLEFPHEMLNMDYNKDVFTPTTDTIAGMIKTDTWPYDLMLCDSYIYQRVGSIVNDPNWGEKYLTDFKNDPWYINSHLDNLFETDLYTSAYGGIAPGAYIEGIWNVMYVSSLTEKKLGLKVKTSDMTIEDFKSYAKEVYEHNLKNKDKITFFWTVRNDAAMILFTQLVMSELGKDSASSQEEAFVILEKVYGALVEMVPYEPIKQYSRAKTDKHLYEDKILFCYSPSWISLIWQRVNPEGEKQMHPCELPTINTRNKAVSYSGKYNAIFVIPKKAKNKEGAIELMKFISSQETAEKWVKYSKCPTGLKHRIVYSDLSNDETNIFSQHIRSKYNNKLAEVNLAKVLFKKNKSIRFYVTDVMSGNFTASEILENIRNQLKD